MSFKDKLKAGIAATEGAGGTVSPEEAAAMDKMLGFLDACTTEAGVSMKIRPDLRTTVLVALLAHWNRKLFFGEAEAKQSPEEVDAYIQTLTRRLTDGLLSMEDWVARGAPWRLQSTVMLMAEADGGHARMIGDKTPTGSKAH